MNRTNEAAFETVIEAHLLGSGYVRVVPDGFKRPALPRLSKATTDELVKLLEHPNGWHRDTASRLLYQKQDARAIAPLQKLAKESRAEVYRFLARYLKPPDPVK